MTSALNQEPRFKAPLGKPPSGLLPSPQEYSVPAVVAVPAKKMEGKGGSFGASGRGLQDPGKTGPDAHDDFCSPARHTIAFATKTRDPNSVGPGQFGGATQRVEGQKVGLVGPGSHIGQPLEMDAVNRKGPVSSASTFGSEPRYSLTEAIKRSGAEPHSLDSPAPTAYSVRPAVPPIKLSKALLPVTDDVEVKRKSRTRLKGYVAAELKVAQTASPAGFTPRKEHTRIPNTTTPKHILAKEKADREANAEKQAKTAAFSSSSPRKHFTVYLTRLGYAGDPFVVPPSTRYNVRSSLEKPSHNARSTKSASRPVTLASDWKSLTRTLGAGAMAELKKHNNRRPKSSFSIARDAATMRPSTPNQREMSRTAPAGRSLTRPGSGPPARPRTSSGGSGGRRTRHRPASRASTPPRSRSMGRLVTSPIARRSGTTRRSSPTPTPTLPASPATLRPVLKDTGGGGHHHSNPASPLVTRSPAFPAPILQGLKG